MSEPSVKSDHSLPIRRGMDVYSAYQNQYLGSVIKVKHGACHRPGAAEPHTTQRVEQPTHDHTARRSLGEDLGPFPTRAVGNTGPAQQAAGQHYATMRRDALPEVVYFVVRISRPGVLNPFGQKLYIPVSAILSLSMERIVVNMQPDHIPTAWYQRPDRF